MKKKLLCILLLVAGFFLFDLNLMAQSLSDGKTKSSWYIGFGLGSGDGSWDDDGETVTFDEWSEGATDKTTLTINFGIGAIVTPNLHIGGEASAIRHQFNFSGYEYSTQINNYMIVASFYPAETGFFLKGGIGRSVFVMDIETVGKATENGFGAIAGLGYNFWLGETFNLGLNFDFSYQKYSGSSSGLQQSRFYNFYVSCYWF